MGISPALRKKLEARKKKLEEGGKKYPYLIFKEGVYRIRILPVGEEDEPGREIIHFYLGGEIKGVISPASIGKKCAILEAYNELLKGDESDKEDASKFKPKKKYLLPCILYKDLKGKEVDTDKGDKGKTAVLLSSTQYKTLLEYFLDEDEWGDFTDPVKGYDIKVKRAGSGQYDTEYTFTPCSKTKTPKGFTKPTDMEKLVAGMIPSYEDTKGILDQYLGTSGDDEDEAPKKKKGKGSKASSKKKVKSSKKRRGDDE